MNIRAQLFAAASVFLVAVGVSYMIVSERFENVVQRTVMPKGLIEESGTQQGLLRGIGSTAAYAEDCCDCWGYWRFPDPDPWEYCGPCVNGNKICYSYTGGLIRECSMPEDCEMVEFDGGDLTITLNNPC